MSLSCWLLRKSIGFYVLSAWPPVYWIQISLGHKDGQANGLQLGPFCAIALFVGGSGTSCLESNLLITVSFWTSSVCFSSFLWSQLQLVLIWGMRSLPKPLVGRMRQGFTLCLSSFYMKSLGEIICWFGIFQPWVGQTRLLQFCSSAWRLWVLEEEVVLQLNPTKAKWL